jgi:hypothetical protein
MNNSSAPNNDILGAQKRKATTNPLNGEVEHLAAVAARKNLVLLPAMVHLGSPSLGPHQNQN